VKAAGSNPAAGTRCVHDVVWQPATLPWWMRGFKSPWTLSLRMWESLGIRQLGVLESVGSNPTILTDVLSRSTTVVRPPVKGRDVGSNPTGTARRKNTANHDDMGRVCGVWNAGRASQQARWHPLGRRTRRKPLQVRVLSLPLTRTCSWESSQAPTLTQWVQILPFLLFGPVTKLA
jgi:hypothetical protein